jgi:hypothetical protein
MLAHMANDRCDFFSRKRVPRPNATAAETRVTMTKLWREASMGVVELNVVQGEERLQERMGRRVLARLSISRR